MRRGYLTPPVLIGLAIICLVTAATIFFNTFLIRNAQNPETPNPTPSPQTDETANWKTYVNDDYDFSFQYPENWEFNQVKNPKDDPDLRPAGIGEFSTFGYPYIRFFDLVDKKSRLKIAVITENLNNLEKSLNINSNTSINGRKVLKYSTGAYVLLEPRTNELLWMYGVEYQSKYFDHILSTFKFLDQPIEGEFCGGIAGLPCPSGFECVLDGDYPDAGGKCVKN